MKRGVAKPVAASRDFRIWGARNVLTDPEFNPPNNHSTERSETSQALSVPKNPASQKEAHRASLRLAIEESVRRRAPVKNIKGDMPLFEEDEAA